MKRGSPNDLLPAASLIGIFAGFVAFLCFGDLVLCLIAAVVGGVAGCVFAGDEESAQRVGADEPTSRYSASSFWPT